MFELPFRVDYVDTDAMGVMHHASYFRYLERCRVEWMRQGGIDYARLEKEGLYLPLFGAEIDYKRSMRFDDHGVVKLGIGELTKVRIGIFYDVVTLDGELVARAITRHALCRRETSEGESRWSVQRLPADWKGLEKWLLPNATKR